MDSTRQLKFSRLVQKELGDIFIRQSKILFGGAMITVTHVKVSPDFSSAKIHLSLFLTKDPDALLKLIQENKPEIRKLLGERIRKQARIIPELVFFRDNSLDYVEKIEKLLKGKPGKK